MLQNKAGLDLTVSKTGGLVSLNFLVKLSMCSHGVLPPKLWGKSFCLSKIFWVGLEIFFIWRGSPYGGLTKMIVKGGFNFKNLTCVFVLSFSQFRKTVYLYNTDCDVICLLLCRNVYVSKIWTWPNNISCTDDFLILWVWYLFNFIVVNEGDWPYQKSQASGE